MENYCVVYRSDAIADRTLSLQHYGVLGMKWGVRRTPEQLGRHTIPKGTTMYRMTTNPNEKHAGHAYVSYLPPDRDRYRRFKLLNNKYEYEKTYKLTKDLNVPSRAELTDVIYQAMKTDLNKKFLKEVADSKFNAEYLSGDRWMSDVDALTIDKILEEIYKTNASNAESRKIIRRYAGDRFKTRIDDIRNKIANQTPDELMVSVMESFDDSSGIRSSVIDELKRRGYNAIVDENDVGGESTGRARSGVEPLIVFDRQEALSETGTTRINEKMARDSNIRYQNWEHTANRHRKNRQW